MRKVTRKVSFGPSNVANFWYSHLRDLPESRVVDQILAEFEPTPAILKGLAVHELLEKCEHPWLWRGDMFYSKEANMWLSYKEVEPVLRYRKERLQNRVHEIWLDPLVYYVDGWEVKMWCKVDSIDMSMPNGHIEDYKVKIAPPRGQWVQQYMQSPQWMMYCKAGNAKQFSYHIFAPDREGIIRPYEPQIKLFWDDAQEQQLDYILSLFWDFCRRHNLFERRAEFKNKTKKRKYANHQRST